MQILYIGHLEKCVYNKVTVNSERQLIDISLAEASWNYSRLVFVQVPA